MQLQQERVIFYARGENDGRFCRIVFVLMKMIHCFSDSGQRKIFGTLDFNVDFFKVDNWKFVLISIGKYHKIRVNVSFYLLWQV